MTSLYEIEVETTDGQRHKLDRYKGQVLLVVNTASKCGLATQFEGLQNLYEKYQNQGLTVLGFPSDQFMNQEYDDINQTLEFCQTNYGVTFPMFAKIQINGEKEHPLYALMKEKQSGKFGGKIKWNFTKFLIDQEGEIVNRYAPTTEPEKIEEDIVSLLKKQ